MITDKILIIAPYPYQINSGGPSGFIAHNLVDKPRDCFELSHDLFQAHQAGRSWGNRLTTKIGKTVAGWRQQREDFLNRHYFHSINAHRYRYLYFHDTLYFPRYQTLISPQQVVILQSHSPELPSEEYRFHNPADTEGYRLRRKAEQAAFARADIIVFPHPGCVPLYESLLPANSDIRFILSGAKNTYDETPIDTSALQDDKINLMYIGRRNAVKGFDIVLDAYRRARRQRDDLHLILVGHGEPIHEAGITDVGFSSNPLGWYHAVDYLVNANRQSYFDLSVIEAVSTGVPILMSDNNGHAYYRNRSPLIQTFNAADPDGLYRLLSGPLHKRDRSRQDNRLLYEAELSDHHYHQRLQAFVRSLPSPQAT